MTSKHLSHRNQIRKGDKITITTEGVVLVVDRHGLTLETDSGQAIGCGNTRLDNSTIMREGKALPEGIGAIVQGIHLDTKAPSTFVRVGKDMWNRLDDRIYKWSDNEVASYFEITDVLSEGTVL